ncbi:MAG: LLM class flavin-dependent oxidoreductase, partial [Thermomicrobiaceae bacterium]|nr:LLM class flavin-dependent oxidoreductase [Thermomicrobiaceae bacterium]
MARRPAPLFGINIDPGTADPQDPFRRARIADLSDIDLATIQDHPYVAHFFDTWMLLSMLAQATERVHLGTNVSPIPLRPPAMLAKAAASLDVLSGGRIELGIGAGAFPQGIAALGGTIPPRPEIVPAFDEAIQVIRGLWQSQRSFSFSGTHYQLRGTRFGPRPVHPIRIWVGATKPRMLRLAGQRADGVLITNTYVPEERLPEVNRLIDEGASRAERDPTEIRRGYNLMGAIALPRLPNESDEVRSGAPVRTVDG